MDLVSQFTQYLLADRGYSPATASDYERDLREFEVFYKDMEEQLDWLSIDADIVRRWMAHKMETGLQARTMKRRLAALRSFYRFLLRVGIAEVNPAAKVVNPKMNKRLPVFLKEAEMEQLFERTHFGEGFVALRDRLVLLIFYTTGVRVSELVALTTDDVNLLAGELKVTGKRNKQRIIPFGEELREELRAYLEERRALETECLAPQLIVSQSGGRMTAAQLRDIVKRYLSLVTTQKKKSPHVLRHTFATVMLNHGADLSAVKELLGHESLAATEVYTHATFADLKKQYASAHPRERKPRE